MFRRSSSFSSCEALEGMAPVIGRAFSGSSPAEEILRRQLSLLQGSDEALIAWDWTGGAITFWNLGAERLYGFSRDETLGGPVAQHLGGAGDARWAAIVQALRSDGAWEGTLERRGREAAPMLVHACLRLICEEGRHFVLESSRVLSEPAPAPGTLTAACQELETARHSMRESESLLRMVTDPARVGLAIVDSAHRYCYTNRAYADTFHLPAGSLTGLRVADVLAPVYESQIRPRLERAFAGERVTHDLRMPPQAPGAQSRQYAVAYEPGAAVVMVVVIADVTPIRLSEERLRESRQETLDLKAAFNQHAIVAVTDSSGRITEVNDKFCELSKYSRDELLGRDHRLINSGAHPAAFFAGLWAAIGAGRVWQGDICNRAKDGTLYWLATTIVPYLDAAAKPRQYVAICADITAHKAAEAALRDSEALFSAAFHSNPAPFALTRLRDSINLEVNDSLLRLFECKREDLLGHSFEEGGFTSAQTVGFLRAQLAANGVLAGEEVEMRTRAGKTRFVAVSVRIIEIQGEPCALSIMLDITARKTAEAALRQSEERIQIVFENMTDGLVLCDLNGNQMVWNRAALALHGFADAETAGKSLAEVLPVFELFTPEHSPVPAEAWPIARVLRGEAVCGHELRIRRTGSAAERIFCYNGSLVRGLGGPHLAFLTITDITERKRAEAALRLSESTLASTEKLSGIGSFTWDMAGGNSSCSQNMYRLLDLDPALPASGVLEFFLAHVLHPEDLPRLSQVIEGALAGTRPYDVEYRIIRRDGTLRHIHARGEVARDAQGRPVSMHGWIQNLTEQKKAAAALRESEVFNKEVLDSLTAEIAVLDHKGVVVTVNEAWRRFGMNAQSAFICDCVGQNYLDVCEREARERPGGSAAAVLKGIRAVMAGTQDYFGMVYDCPCPDGMRWFQLHVCPLTTRSRAVVTAHEDITARFNAEEKIRLLNADLEQRVAKRTAQLEAANKELEAFSYSVSHDLRAPLRAIDGFSVALIEDYSPLLPAEAQGYLNIIRDGAKKMGALIDDLLAFSRLSRSPLKGRLLKTSALVKEVLEDLNARQTGRQIEVHCEELPDCWGDPALLRQVWINLLSNAFKYTQKRPQPRVEIGSTLRDGVPVYFVRDNGTGFDMRYAGKLFGVFQRLHRADQYEGTGVGLAIVQRIVQRHGGLIWAEAVVDQGATFFFTLAAAGEDG